ncbi:MAG: ribonuclease HI [Mucinivorans sp.]
MERINIYTDGSALGNPGAGGYGVVMMCGPFRREISAGYRLTTNNRMELLAVIVALEALKREKAEVMVFSDSKYVVDAVTKRWVFAWVAKNFKDKKNEDLWRRFLKIYNQHMVNFTWVKGHNDIPENERCDRLAVAAAGDKTHLMVDEWYEANGISKESV